MIAETSFRGRESVGATQSSGESEPPVVNQQSQQPCNIWHTEGTRHPSVITMTYEYTSGDSYNLPSRGVYIFRDVYMFRGTYNPGAFHLQDLYPFLMTLSFLIIFHVLHYTTVTLFFSLQALWQLADVPIQLPGLFSRRLQATVVWEHVCRPHLSINNHLFKETLFS